MQLNLIADGTDSFSLPHTGWFSVVNLTEIYKFLEEGPVGMPVWVILITLVDAERPILIVGRTIPGLYNVEKGN